MNIICYHLLTCCNVPNQYSEYFPRCQTISLRGYFCVWLISTVNWTVTCLQMKVRSKCFIYLFIYFLTLLKMSKVSCVADVHKGKIWCHKLFVNIVNLAYTHIDYSISPLWYWWWWLWWQCWQKKSAPCSFTYLNSCRLLFLMLTLSTQGHVWFESFPIPPPVVCSWTGALSQAGNHMTCNIDSHLIPVEHQDKWDWKC